MAVEFTHRQRRWLDALVVLATIALAFIVVGFVADLFFAFGDVLLIFFLAWLIAFVLNPLATSLERAFSRLPHVLAVVVVYGVVIGLLLLALLLAANALAGSIRDLITSLPTLRQDLPQILAPWQRRVDDLGLAVNLVDQADVFLDNVSRYAQELSGPLQQLAVASLGVVGSILIVVILSLYITIDRDRILSFLYRLVPPRWDAEARLLQVSLSRSFGGFLRGQAVIGLIYAVVAAVTNLGFGLEFAAATTAAAGLLMAIPFFGPFLAWAPPVLVAILFQPGDVLGTFAAMGIGWMIVMNVVQPRVMGDAVGLHPIVVLASVIVGSKVAGIVGAIFGIPIAAVLAAFFFHFFRRTQDRGPVATRAARRLEEREGRPVRLPVEPEPGIDPDVDPARRPDGDATDPPSRPRRAPGSLR